MTYQGSDEREDGGGNYAAFLQEMADKGLLRDGDRVAAEGLALLQATPGHQSTYKLIATVETGDIFKDKQVGLIIDLLARTKFKDRQERINCLDYISWCIEFGVGLDNAIRYVASARSEGGESIEQLIQAMTTFNHRQYSYGNKNQISTRDKSRKGSLP